MTVYADSSFLSALYLPDPYTDPFPIWRDVGEMPLPFNPMHRLEVRNTIRRRGQDHNLITKLLADLDDDVSGDDVSGDLVLVHQPLNWTDVLRRAEEMSSQYTEQTRIRGYDLFHLAVAVETGHDTLLTFDDVQAQTARLVGLAVYGA